MSQEQPKPPPPSTPQKSSVSTSVVKKELSNSDLGIPDLPSLEFTSIFKSVKKGVKTGVKTAVKAGKSLCFSRFHRYSHLVLPNRVVICGFLISISQIVY